MGTFSEKGNPILYNSLANVSFTLTISQNVDLKRNHADMFSSIFSKTHFRVLDLWIPSGICKVSTRNAVFFMLILCRMLGPLLALEAKKTRSSAQFSTILWRIFPLDLKNS